MLEQVYTTPGTILLRFVDELYSRMLVPLTVVETGCLRRSNAGEELADGWSSLYLAQWVSEHHGSQLFSVDIEPKHIAVAKEKIGDAAHVSFYEGDSVEFLKTFWRKIDFAYLDTADSHEHGLAEFLAASNCGAQMIVMDDHDSKVIKAEQYAKESGLWSIEQNGRFTVFRRINA